MSKSQLEDIKQLIESHKRLRNDLTKFSKHLAWAEAYAQVIMKTLEDK